MSEMGKQLGIMSARDAYKLAQEVSFMLAYRRTAKPPVCKIIDYGNMRATRKEKEAKKKQ